MESRDSRGNAVPRPTRTARRRDPTGPAGSRHEVLMPSVAAATVAWISA